MPDHNPDRLKRFHHLLKLARDARQDIEEAWEKDLKLLHAEDGGVAINTAGFVEKTKMKSKVNYLHSQNETIKAILSSASPQIVYTPSLGTEAWAKIGETFESLSARVLAQNDIRARIMDCVDNGLKRGKGYFKMTWDKSMWDGLGGIRITVPNTKSIFLEPGVMEIADSNYIFEVNAINQVSLLRRFPEREDEIRSLFRRQGAQESGPDGKATDAEVATAESVEINPSAPGASSNTSSESVHDLGSMNLYDESKPMTVDLIEMWYHSDEMEDFDSASVNPKSGKMKRATGKRRKFPNGRVVLFAGGVVFDDRPNEFPGFPYSAYCNYRDTDKQYKITELRHTAPIQRQYDTRNNQLYDLLNFNLAAIRYFGAGSGVDASKMTNTPGLMVPALDVSQIKVEQPPGIPSDAFISLDKIQRELEIVYGVEAINRGAVPGDIRSGAAIEALVEQADTRLRSKSGELESLFMDIGAKLITMFQKHYIEGVHFVIRGEVADSDEPNNTLEIRETPEWKFWEKKQIGPHFFNIKVQAGVNRPRSRVAKQQFIQWLALQGFVDGRYVLEHSDMEGKEELLERMGPVFEEELKARLAQAQLAQQQPQPGQV